VRALRSRWAVRSSTGDKLPNLKSLQRIVEVERRKVGEEKGEAVKTAAIPGDEGI
jgi:hypothetical protein